jgi:drug/metabolite transporter (DMT)-like permease
MRADLALLLASAIWGSAFVAQRVAAQHLDAFLFNGLRFLLGAFLLLPPARGKWKGLSWQSGWGAALAGLILFGGAALQQLGLKSTTAGKAGFITGLYVVLIPLILAVVFRQRPRRSIWMAALLATCGLFLLSAGRGGVTALLDPSLRPAGSLGGLSAGDGLELAGAVLWAVHVIWIGRLVHRLPLAVLAVLQYLACGTLNLAAAALIGRGIGPSAPVEVWWAVAYTGIFSIGVGYTLQAAGQRWAPPADAAILLSAEAIFAALAGWLLLGERLDSIQVAGCGLILAGMLLSQLGAKKSGGLGPVEK